MKLSSRDIMLLNGMIEVQLNHAERCDKLANRVMADKQKGWDMERVGLLKRIIESANLKPCSLRDVNQSLYLKGK